MLKEILRNAVVSNCAPWSARNFKEKHRSEVGRRNGGLGKSSNFNESRSVLCFYILRLLYNVLCDD